MPAIGFILTIAAVFQLTVGILAWAGALPGNSVVGLRVPEVRKSKKLWILGHRIAGPLWAVGGACLALGAVVSFKAQGWLWLIPVIAIIAWFVFLGMGAAMGAHTVAMADAKGLADDVPDQSGDSCGEGSCSCGGDTKPHEVDVAALRRLAKNTDNNENQQQ